MRRAILLVCFLLATGPAGAVTPTLTPVPDQQTARAGYRRATLRVTNDTADVVRTVRLRRDEGGSALLVPMLVPPDQTQQAEVALPAVWPTEVYRVEALADADAPALSAGQAEIAWPLELLTTDWMIDPTAYNVWGGELPHWHPPLLRAAAVGAVGYVAGAAGLLLVRQRRLRLLLGGGLCLLGLAAAVGLWTYEPLDVREVPADALAVPDPSQRRLLVVGTRRTATWRHPEDLVPIYYSGRQLGRDPLVRTPEGIRVVVRPDEIRLFLRP